MASIVSRYFELYGTGPAHTRLAPTPSGFLHEGNAYSFLLTWLIARCTGGSLFLRIDDLDGQRKRPEYVEDVFETIAWLGIDFDRGPLNAGDFEKNYSQALRIGQYNSVLETLVRSGHVFLCTCTRAARTLPHRCSCRAMNLPLDRDGSWRFYVDDEAVVSPEQGRTFELGRLQGSFVVRRRDGLPAYQVTSIADDIHARIDTVVRGEDLVPSSAMQTLLLETIGAKVPRFFHHGLLLENGLKLSKSTQSPPLAPLRSASPAPLIARFCRWAGLPESGTAEEALEKLQLLKNA